MDPMEEKFLRAVAKASDNVKFDHQDLQKMVQRGTKRQVLAAAKKLVASTKALASIISKEGRWPESY